RGSRGLHPQAPLKCGCFAWLKLHTAIIVDLAVGKLIEDSIAGRVKDMEARLILSRTERQQRQVMLGRISQVPQRHGDSDRVSRHAALGIERGPAVLV